MIITKEKIEVVSLEELERFDDEVVDDGDSDEMEHDELDE